MKDILLYPIGNYKLSDEKNTGRAKITLYKWTPKQID